MNQRGLTHHSGEQSSRTRTHASTWELSIADTIDAVSQHDWNRLVPGEFPFLRHEYLGALERSGCVSRNTGWLPAHIVIRNAQADQQMLAVAPMYVKYHSRGEFIFDWSWANFYHDNGQSYYPKLVLQSPFTPLMAPKVLVSPKASASEVRGALFESSAQIASALNVSSMHWLFITDEELESAIRSRCLHRAGGIQFIWNNADYGSMDDFLAALSSSKRKKIRQERRSVIRQNVTVEAIEGKDLTDAHWDAVLRCYDHTTDKYMAHKYLSADFFEMIGSSMPENMVVFLATKENRHVAASFCLRGEGALYGRYWGALEYIPNLHFELCYYSAVEYCIEQGISSYDAGIRGEHKLQRGFMPKLMYAAHYLANEELGQVIRNSLNRETNYYSMECDMLSASSPYRRH